jgi:BirA family transcriptional regulator, biotin operon repressor / biotin---[acetyl-CoA-carboxylase] ligase
MKIGNVIRRFDTCPSTNAEARILALAGDPEGTVVVADRQTAGRGTRGRAWFSPSGKGLYMTILLRPDFPELGLIPLAAGLAAFDAASESPDTGLRLKWPNDLVHEGRKLGGILCEAGSSGTRSRFVIVGIGLNAAHDPEDFPPEIRGSAGSLKTVPGGRTDREALLGALCGAFEVWYNIIHQGKGETIVRIFQERMTLTPGELISLEAGGERISGTYIGLDSSGGLVCDDGKRRTTHHSAEIRALARA